MGSTWDFFFTQNWIKNEATYIRNPDTNRQKKDLVFEQNNTCRQLLKLTKFSQNLWIDQRIFMITYIVKNVDQFLIKSGEYSFKIPKFFYHFWNHFDFMIRSTIFIFN